jgi:catechol 2,3-dioxygenase
MNTWESEDGDPTPENSAGLREFSISLPHQAELDRLAAQIEAAGISVERDGDSLLIRDPFGTRIKLVLASSVVGE